MIDALIDLLGGYNPVMTDVYNDVGEYVGQSVAAGAAGVDWSFVAAAALLLVFVFCFFKFLGGVFKR